MTTHDPDPTCNEIITSVLDFFDGDEEKTAYWLVAMNPNFGNLSPRYLMSMGQAHMVLAFVRDAMEANAAAPYPVTCARCGAAGTSATFCIEEGDEWECPPCNARENARERAEVKS